MARALRSDMPDGLCHVTFRRVQRRGLAREDPGRARRAGLLDRVAAGRRWRVVA